MKRTNSELQKLADSGIKIGEILEACPFDPNKNLNKLLTEDIFFENIFSISDHFTELCARLSTTIESRTENVRVVFIDGFSGTGKTTFLKYFIRIYGIYEHIYLDFHALSRGSESTHSNSLIRKNIEKAERILAKTLEQRREEDKEPLAEIRALLREVDDAYNPVISTVKNHISSMNVLSVIDCIEFAAKNLRQLAPYFSKSLLAEMRIAKEHIMGDRGSRDSVGTFIHEIINACDFSDTFILFFILCLKNRKHKKKTIVYFDNLDAVDLDYVSDYFRKSFANVLTSTTSLTQEDALFAEEIDFIHEFCFIFCLRDANGAVLNAHIADSLGHTAQAINFRVGFDSGLYQSIIDNRMKFFKRLAEISRTRSNQADEESVPVQRVLDVLTAFSNDKYFDQVVVPLFNGDFRKLVLALIKLSTKSYMFEDGAGPYPSLIDFKSSGTLDKYGLRGKLLAGVIRILREENFLIKYPFFDINIDPTEGYCLHSRMILTVLLYCSDFKKSSSISDFGKTLSPVALGDLIGEFHGVYDIEEVITTLVDAFLFYKRNWVHLVTFRNRAVLGRGAFSREIESADMSKLQEVSVNLNPSGFVYLKHLLTHFEFYSSLLGNETPLFSLGLEPGGRGSGNRFLFEDYVDKVISLVRQHVESMTTFYKRNFRDKLGWTTQMYRTSKFSFKHFGEGHPKKRGYFHSTRVIQSHINYVDTYRRLTLRRFSEDEKLFVSLNRSLVSRIRKYIGILEISVDDKAPFFIDGFLRNVKIIEDSGFKDSTTRIFAID